MHAPALLQFTSGACLAPLAGVELKRGVRRPARPTGAAGAVGTEGDAAAGGKGRRRSKKKEEEAEALIGEEWG